MKNNLSFLLGFVLLLAACGDDETTQASPTSSPDPTATLSRPPTRTATEERPWFGIGFNQMIPNILSIIVDTGGPADQAGIQNGDIITAINRIDVSPENIAEVFSTFSVGEIITVTVERAGEGLEFEVMLEAAPDSAATETQILGFPSLGIAVEFTDTQVVVKDVLPTAQARGISLGDIIIAVNNTAFTSIEDAISLFSTLPPGEVTLTLDDNGTARTITLVAVEVNAIPTLPTSQSNPMFDSASFAADTQVWTLHEVMAIGPLAQLGLQADDQITSINGEPLSPADLEGILNQVTTDTELEIIVIRDDETLTLTVSGVLVPALLRASSSTSFPFGNAAQPTLLPPMLQSPQTPPANTGGLPFDPSTFSQSRPEANTGLIVVPLSERIVNEYGLSPDGGVFVIDLEPGVPVVTSGIQQEDVITAVNGVAISAENSFDTLIAQYDAGDVVVLDVIRSGEPIIIELTLFRANSELPFEQSPQTGTSAGSLPTVDLPPVPLATTSGD